MQAADEFFLARTLDHIVVEAIGLLIAYMGYRLFREMPALREGSAKFGLPGGVSIYLSRIGPGAFFVLFGAALIGYTATRPVTIQQAPGSVSIAGFSDRSTPNAPGISSGTAQTASNIPRPGLVRTLAELAAENDKAPISQTQIEHAAALREARIEIMLAGWDPTWGNPQDFRQWTNSMDSAPPAAARRAVAVFRGQ